MEVDQDRTQQQDPKIERLAVEDEVVLDAELVAGGVVRLSTTVVLDAATVVPEVVDWRH